MRLHRSVAAIAIVAGLGLFGTSTASAQPDPADYATTDRAQTPGNTAGVIFHPLGDRFEIWDNDKNGLPVRVFYNYVGVDDAWKTVTSRRHHSLIRRNLAEFPRQIYYYVEGSARTSPIVKYRTYGS
jgi:hypothetical protein